MAELARILEEDPDLAEGLEDDAAADARRALVARIAVLPQGRWHPRHPPGPGDVGLLVLGGVLRREVFLDESSISAELLGHGDVLRPLSEDPASSLPTEVRWFVVEEARLAVLDRRFTLAASRYPEVVTAFVHRASLRSYRNSLTQAIIAAPRVETRLVAVLWALADRWGTVTSDGVVLRVPLTHQALAELVGARRPSVTTALGRLEQEGLLTRTDRTCWILHGEPPVEREDFRVERP